MTVINGPGYPAHAPEPLPGTAVTIGGPRHLRPFDERLMRAFPGEGLCTCGQVVRRDAHDLGWEHTGRMPGDSI